MDVCFIRYYPAWPDTGTAVIVREPYTTGGSPCELRVISEIKPRTATTFYPVRVVARVERDGTATGG